MWVKFQNLEINYVLALVTSLFDVPEERTVIVPQRFSIKEDSVDGYKSTLSSEKTDPREPNTFKTVTSHSLY